MKKVFNLSVILAVLMAAFSFTSCSDDDDSSAPVITIESTTGSAVFGSITSENDLQSVDLQLNGRSVDGWPKTNFAAGQPISGSNGVYLIAIQGLAAGNYTLVAKDKEDKQDSKSFTLGATDWTTGVSTITANGTYYYKQGSTTGVVVVSNLATTTVVVSLDGKTAVTLDDGGASYLLKDGTASQKSGATASNFLLAKKNGVAAIVDNDGLTTPIAGAEDVLFVKAN